MQHKQLIFVYKFKNYGFQIKFQQAKILSAPGRYKGLIFCELVNLLNFTNEILCKFEAV